MGRASEALAYLAMDDTPRRLPAEDGAAPVYPKFKWLDLPNPELEQRRRELSRHRRKIVLAFAAAP